MSEDCARRYNVAIAIAGHYSFDEIVHFTSSKISALTQIGNGFPSFSRDNTARHSVSYNERQHINICEPAHTTLIDHDPSSQERAGKNMMMSAPLPWACVASRSIKYLFFRVYHLSGSAADDPARLFRCVCWAGHYGRAEHLQQTTYSPLV